MDAVQRELVQQDGNIDVGDATMRNAVPCPPPATCFPFGVEKDELLFEDLPQQETHRAIITTPLPEKVCNDEIKLPAKRGRGLFIRRLLDSSDTSDSEETVSTSNDYELPGETEEETTSPGRVQPPPAKVAKINGQGRCRAIERALSAHEKHSHWLEKIPSAPVYTPTMEEWQMNPLQYIKSIQREASQAGICLIKPPVTPVIPPGLVLGRKQFTTRQQRIRNLTWNSNWQSQAKFYERGSPYQLKEFKENADDFASKRLGIHGLLPTRAIELQYWAERDPEGKVGHAQTYVEYGNDVEGSAFSDDDPVYGSSFWNLNKLPMSAGSPLSELSSSIPGVSTPMLYVGMLFSTFAWHVEDHCLYSINFHHAGAPKVWYGVPSCSADALEKALSKTAYYAPCQAMNDNGKDDVAVQNRVKAELMDKNTMVKPSELQNHGVLVYRVVQEVGTFVVTFPRAYHSGFSCGFNVGEAVNFGCDDWWRFAESAFDVYCHLRRPHIIPQEEILYKVIMQYMTRGQAVTLIEVPHAVNVFLRMIDRFRKLRQNLTARGAWTVVARSDDGKEKEAGSLECARCLSPCFFCSAVVNPGTSPDGWQHVCLKCADEATKEQGVNSSGEEGGIASKATHRTLVFVKPCWNSAESASMELRKVLKSPTQCEWVPLPQPCETLPQWAQMSHNRQKDSIKEKKPTPANGMAPSNNPNTPQLAAAGNILHNLPVATVVRTDQVTLADGRVVRRRVCDINGNLAVYGADVIYAIFPEKTMRQMPSSGGWMESCFRRIKRKSVCLRVRVGSSRVSVIQEEDAKVLMSDGALENDVMKGRVGAMLSNVWDSPEIKFSVEETVTAKDKGKEGSGVDEGNIVDVVMV